MVNFNKLSNRRNSSARLQFDSKYRLLNRKFGMYALVEVFVMSLAGLLFVTGQSEIAQDLMNREPFPPKSNQRDPF